MLKCEPSWKAGLKQILTRLDELEKAFLGKETSSSPTSSSADAHAMVESEVGSAEPKDQCDHTPSSNPADPSSWRSISGSRIIADLRIGGSRDPCQLGP